jgi:nicotinic acid mononucleotide adenylyltransferase
VKNLKNFSQYLIEEERECYFTFGRMNPPTIGHGKVMDTLASKSGKSDYKVFVSQSQNPKKDPLTYSQKVKHIRKMFPKHARNVMMDKKIKNVFDVAASLYDQGYRNVTMVVGADRIREFETFSTTLKVSR